MSKPNPYKWTVEIEIDPVWVADGLDLTQERMEDILQSALGWISGSEMRVSILRAPDPKQIRAEQGYSEPGYEPIEP